MIYGTRHRTNKNLMDLKSFIICNGALNLQMHNLISYDLISLIFLKQYISNMIVVANMLSQTIKSRKTFGKAWNLLSFPPCNKILLKFNFAENRHA